MKLYDPKSGKPFNWKRAYSPTDVSAASSNGSRVRLWRFFDLVAPSQKFSPETPNMDFPFSVKPDKKISVRDVMTMTRDKCEGTPFDPARGLQGGPFDNPNYLPYGFELEGKRYDTARVIGVNRAEYVTVTQSRGWLPNPVGGIVWLAWGAQDTSCFMPLYAGITRHPAVLRDRRPLGLQPRLGPLGLRLRRLPHPGRLQPGHPGRPRGAAELREDGGLIGRRRSTRRALELYKKDPAQASRFLTDYCLGNADHVVGAWWKLGDDLLVKFNHQWMYDVKARKRLPVKYPDWYLKLLVDYDKVPAAPRARSTRPARRPEEAFLLGSEVEREDEGVLRRIRVVAPADADHLEPELPVERLRRGVRGPHLEGHHLHPARPELAGEVLQDVLTDAHAPELRMDGDVVDLSLVGDHPIDDVPDHPVERVVDDDGRKRNRAVLDLAAESALVPRVRERLPLDVHDGGDVTHLHPPEMVEFFVEISFFYFFSSA